MQSSSLLDEKCKSTMLNIMRVCLNMDVYKEYNLNIKGAYSVHVYCRNSLYPGKI